MDKINKTDEEFKYCYKYHHPSVTTDCVIFGSPLPTILG